jgi:hypothetical protein
MERDIVEVYEHKFEYDKEEGKYLHLNCDSYCKVNGECIMCGVNIYTIGDIRRKFETSSNTWLNE